MDVIMDIKLILNGYIKRILNVELMDMKDQYNGYSMDTKTKRHHDGGSGDATKDFRGLQWAKKIHHLRILSLSKEV